MIQSKSAGPVRFITFNRASVLNSFNSEMARQFLLALTEAGDSPDVRCIVLIGAGKAFCAGQDLQETLERTEIEPALGKVVREIYLPIIMAIQTVSKPVICALNGVAAGAGASIALACDVIVASESASIIQSFINVGLVPDAGGTYHLPRLVGYPQAAYFMMTGEKITAQRGLELGIIQKVVPAETFNREVGEFAEFIASKPPLALQKTKELLRRSEGNDLITQLNLEADSQEEMGKTNDYSEGIAAFLQKRRPLFKGN